MAKAARRARRRAQPAFLTPAVAVSGVLSLVVPAMWLMLRGGDGSAEAAGDSVPFSTMTDDRFPTSAAPTPSPTAATPTSTASTTPSLTPSETPGGTPGWTPTPTGVPTSEQTLLPTVTPTSGRTSSGRTRKPTPTLVTTTPTATSTPTDDGDMTDRELTRFQQINDERARNGCDPVLPDSRLTHVARAQASYVDDSDDFTHEDANGSDPRHRMEAAGVSANSVGEYLQAGDNTSGWSGGAGDPATDCGVRRLGVGYDGGDVCMHSWLLGCYDWADPIWVEDYAG